MQVYINSIGTAVPPHKIRQSEIADFMSGALDMDEEEKQNLRVLYRASGIQYRHSVLEDYGRLPNDYSFFPKNKSLLPFPGIGKRMRIYEQEATGLCLKAIRDALPDSFNKHEITHLVTVSCTGMYAPGIDIDLVQELNLPTTTKRTAVNFMGCYGAFNGMKVANDICKAAPGAVVLLVAVELCTLHFQKKKDPDTLLANALFSDGAAAALISTKPTKGSFSIQGFHSDIAVEGKGDMAWQIGDHGFEMKLSSVVPSVIEKHIVALTNTLLAQLNCSMDEIEAYAIHPGGKRILEVIEQKLKIKKEQNAAAYKVLKENGNMSSPTVLFVLKALKKELPKGGSKQVLSFAFGPGLTLESMLLKVLN